MKTGEVVKNLTFYEMDLGLNHVVRKSTEKVDITCSEVVSVPGGSDGPGGVIVFAEDCLYYHSYPKKTLLKCMYPKRIGVDSQEGVMINSFTFHKQKNLFFFLLQTEYGDLFKLWVDYTGKEVHNLNI